MAILTPQSLLSNLATAANLLNGGGKVDVVGVLAQNSSVDLTTGSMNTVFSQVFSEARPMKALVKETAKVMDHPVETGAILSDHRISNPTEIEIHAIIPQSAYATAYVAIRNAWLNATLLSVQTRTGTYRNMIIADMPHEEDPDKFTAIDQFIRLREVIMVAPSAGQPLLANFSPALPQNQSTVSIGLLSGLAAAGTVMSYFHATSVWGRF